MSPTEAAQLLSQEFGQELDALLSNPADVLAENDPLRFRSDHVAVVDPAGPDPRGLLVSTNPLRTDDGEQVDLSLTRDRGAVEPAATDGLVELPSDLNAPARLPEADVTVRIPDQEGSAAPAKLIEGRDLAFYGNAGAEADVALAAVPGGLEAFAQLRSRQSEVPPIEVGMPAGATLEPDPNGGAQVTHESGESLVTVSPPTAIDADGLPVPTEMQVHGDQLSISVDVSDPAVRMPVLVDPVFNYGWYWTTTTYGLSAWHTTGASHTVDFDEQQTCKTSVPQSCWYQGWFGEFQATTTGVANGLFIYARRNYQYYNGDHLEWTYQVPGSDSCITRFQASPIRWEQGFPGTTTPGAYLMLAPALGSPGVAISGTKRNFVVGDPSASEYNVSYDKPATCGQGAKAAVVGMNAAWTPNEVTSPTFWRYIRVAGTTLTLDDANPPSVPAPGDDAVADTEWVGNTTLSAHATAKDLGLGVASFKLRIPKQGGGFDDYTHSVLDQNGSFTPCLGDAVKPCPSYAYKDFPYSTANIPEGSNTAWVDATDGAGKTTSDSFTVNIDRSDPAIQSLTGDMFEEAAQLTAGHPKVAVHATDMGSGVESIRLLVDGQEQDEISGDALTSDVQTCNQGSCTLTNEFAADLSELAPGAHSVEMRLTDHAGHVASQTGSIVLDPALPSLDVTGDLVTHDRAPLPVSTAGVTIAASDDSSSGDTGISEIAVSVNDQPPATFEFCSPGCPPDAIQAWTFDKAEWGAGPHSVEITTRDLAGNTAYRELSVDVPLEPVDATCTDQQPEVVPSVDPISSSAAAATAATVLPETVAESQATTTETLGVIDPQVTAGDPTDPESTPAPVPGETGAPPTDFSFGQNAVGGAAAANAAQGFTVGNGACLTPTVTTPSAESAQPVEDDALVYANTAPQTDTVLRPAAMGTMLAQLIRGTDAPTQFSWLIGVGPDGGDPVLLQDGSVAIIQPEEPSDGGPIPPPPAGATDESLLVDAETQLNNKAHQFANAEEISDQAVLMVLAPPHAVDSTGASVSAHWSVSNKRITLFVDHQAATSAGRKVTVFAQAAGAIDKRDCPSGKPSPCGKYDKDAAQKYALKWALPPWNYRYWWFDQDCTNFAAQILKKGGFAEMYEHEKGANTGSWWYRNGAVIHSDSDAVEESTDSWRLANVLPRHLWEYDMVAPQAAPNAHDWKIGWFIFLDWQADGAYDHILFVSGRNKKNGVPLMAGHTATYRTQPWPKIKNRIRDPDNNYADGGWRMLILKPTHGRANTWAKRNAGSVDQFAFTMPGT